MANIVYTKGPEASPGSPLVRLYPLLYPVDFRVYYGSIY